MRYGKGVSIIQEVLITSTYIFDLVLDDLILDNLVLDDGTPTGFKADANISCSDWFSFWMGHFVASVASTLRKTGTVVLLGKRPTAESENSSTRAGDFFLHKNHGGGPLSSRNEH